MKRFHILMISVFALMTLLAGPAYSAPAGDRPSTVRITGTIHGAGGANNAPGTFGISQMACRCTVTIDKHSQTWRFKEEPRIEGIDEDGPSAGILREGDVIVAIDGLPITTRKAGRAFGNVEPGQKVELTIRRDGRTLTETIVAVESTTELPRLGSRLDSALTFELERLSVQVEELARQAAQLERLAVLRERDKASLLELRDVLIDLEIPEVPDAPDLPEIHFELPELPELPDVPRSRFGFGLSFSGSLHGDDEHDRWDWDFSSPPRVTSVTKGGRAHRAGIRRGDVITHINGTRIDTRRGGREFSRVKPGETVSFTVLRRGETLTIDMVAADEGEDDE